MSIGTDHQAVRVWFASVGYPSHGPGIASHDQPVETDRGLLLMRRSAPPEAARIIETLVR
ncbi:MAG TPA: hypothetical protein VK070_14445 [Acidimicrobiia bacterium]|nr:hypothetical protein [Acidimicrobiia bacterium]